MHFDVVLGVHEYSFQRTSQRLLAEGGGSADQRRERHRHLHLHAAEILHKHILNHWNILIWILLILIKSYLKKHMIPVFYLKNVLRLYLKCYLLLESILFFVCEYTFVVEYDHMFDQRLYYVVTIIHIICIHNILHMYYVYQNTSVILDFHYSLFTLPNTYFMYIIPYLFVCWCAYKSRIAEWMYMVLFLFIGELLARICFLHWTYEHKSKFRQHM